MGREILFRGKRLNDNRWVEGIFYPRSDGVALIIPFGEPEGDLPISGYSVEPATVGQYTGLMDMNGKRIFEGDLLKDMSGDIFTVFYNTVHCAFMCEYQTNSFKRQGVWRMGDQCSLGIEVIGNIHDTPPNNHN